MDNDYYNLASKIELEDMKDRWRALEATTMDAVSFVPAHMGAVRAKVKQLAKRKHKWGVEILEDDDGNRDVRIEDALRIIVPNEHWDKFQDMFNGELNEFSSLNLKSLLNEAMEDDFKVIRDDLKPALIEMYNGEDFSALDKMVHVWQARFGISEIITNKNSVAVMSSRKGKDIQKLVGNVLHAYRKDRGGLEMLLTDIRTGNPLTSYEVFKKFNYLYGSRVASSYNDIKLIFESSVDMSGMISETIYIGDEAVLDEVDRKSVV